MPRDLADDPVAAAGGGHSRRDEDAEPRIGAYRRALGWVFAQWEPVAGGRLLLLASGTVATVTAPLLQPELRTWVLLAEISAAMIALLIASFYVPWSRLPTSSTVVFPVLVWIAVAMVGIGANGLGANFTGLFALTFAYLGLTQSVATIVRVLPAAVACYIGAYDGWTAVLTPRLLISMSVWLLLALLIAELVNRQNGLASKLRRAAQTDALTGLGNRRDLDHRVALARSGDTLVICDLDHFKRLNDTLGHAAGDRVLAEFGLVLMTCMRENDYAARYGGEEFALVLPATDAASATAMLQRLRHQWAILQPDVTFSAGTASCRDDRPSDRTLVAADRALYAAKAAGRNQDSSESEGQLSSALALAVDQPTR
jgi:diguanylate cyclase (GGDEF)-like protein